MKKMHFHLVNDEFVGAVAKGASIARLTKLLREGASVNSLSKTGWSALYIAVLNRDMQTVALLLKHGADVNFEDVDGDRVLHLALCAETPQYELVELLLTAGCTVDQESLQTAKLAWYTARKGERCHRRDVVCLLQRHMFEESLGRAYKRLRFVR